MRVRSNCCWKILFQVGRYLHPRTSRLNCVSPIFDEAEYRDCTEDAYYQNLYNHVKAKCAAVGKGADVVLNPGKQTQKHYMDSANIIVNFEGNYNAYKTQYTEPAWVHNYPPTFFWHLVHSTPDAASMKDAVSLGQ